MIIIKLSQKEAQAILSASETFFVHHIKKAKENNDLAVFWRILYKHLETGLKKAGKQYDDYITKDTKLKNNKLK